MPGLIWVFAAIELFCFAFIFVSARSYFRYLKLRREFKASAKPQLKEEEESRLTKAASILEGVLAGRLDPMAALKMWPALEDESDKDMETIWHNLSHFANDGDIRRRDAGYAEYQKKLLETDLTKVREKVSKT